MQFFHKPQSIYTEEEKQLAQKMHYISPSLYKKIREEFGFVLPGESAIKSWFNVIHLWPLEFLTLYLII